MCPRSLCAGSPPYDAGVTSRAPVSGFAIVGALAAHRTGLPSSYSRLLVWKRDCGHRCLCRSSRYRRQSSA